MSTGTISDGTFRLTFRWEDKAIACEIQEAGVPGVLTLPCRPQSLANVVKGMRYHFAGGGVLCTIFSNGDVVIVDWQLSTNETQRLSVPLTQYRELLERLQITGES